MENAPADTDRDEALRREAHRVYQRYADEFVEAFDMCPWAARARRTGRVEERVLLLGAPDVPALHAAIAEVAEEERIEVGLLILPRFRLGRRDFERFVGELAAGADRRLALAAFHPDAEVHLDAPMRLVPFIRRTPDPTIQLVRLAVLARIRKGAADQGTDFIDPATIDWSKPLPPPSVPLHERVAEENLSTVTRVGVPELTAVLDDIRADRDRTYARLGEPPTPW